MSELKMELVPWGDTPSHLALVNERCCLREPIEKRSNLNNRDKASVRTYKVLDRNGGTVGGFTVRTNCWYLAEIKYIFAENRNVLDYLLTYALRLGKRPVYHVTAGAKEQMLRNALERSGFAEVVPFTYKERNVTLWGRAVEQRTESVNLLPEEEAAALIEAPKSGTRQIGVPSSTPALSAPSKKEFDPQDDTTWNPSRMYPDEKRKTAKMHKHGDMGWHPISKKHKA